jgi:NADPH-dependent curcumin reductase CurA
LALNKYRDDRINLEIEFSYPFEGWMAHTGLEWKTHKDEGLEEEPKIITFLIKTKNKTWE